MNGTVTGHVNQPKVCTGIIPPILSFLSLLFPIIISQLDINTQFKFPQNTSGPPSLTQGIFCDNSEFMGKIEFSLYLFYKSVKIQVC